MPGPVPMTTITSLSRRDAELFLVSCILGPPVGALAFFIGSALVTPTAAGTLPRLGSGIMLAVQPFVLALSYLVGLLPAAISAILGAALARFVATRRRRILAAPLLGAIATVIAVLGVSVLYGAAGVGKAELEILVALSLTGAASALICTALIERFGTAARQGAEA